MKQILLIAMISLMIFSCKPDNKSKLEKLKKQQSELADQIKALEKVVALENGKDSGKVANVAVNDIKAGEFKHYLEVQGKIDGDQNVAVSPKMLGVITSIDVKEGDVVRTGQVLAHIDDCLLYTSPSPRD